MLFGLFICIFLEHRLSAASSSQDDTHLLLPALEHIQRALDEQKQMLQSIMQMYTSDQLSRDKRERVELVSAQNAARSKKKHRRIQYYCPEEQCDFKSRIKQKFQDHLKSMHDQSRRFCCDTCLRRFKHMRDLRIHATKSKHEISSDELEEEDDVSSPLSSDSPKEEDDVPPPLSSDLPKEIDTDAQDANEFDE